MTTRPPTGPASGTTSTSPTWLVPTCSRSTLASRAPTASSTSATAPASPYGRSSTSAGKSPATTSPRKSRRAALVTPPSSSPHPPASSQTSAGRRPATCAPWSPTPGSSPRPRTTGEPRMTPASSSPGSGSPANRLEADADAAPRGVEWFRECYGDEPEGVWFAPGRVNLIGEHTDYNEGFVLPFAVSQGVIAAASWRMDGMLALRSRQAPGAEVLVPLDGLAPGGADAGGAVDAA